MFCSSMNLLLLWNVLHDKDKDPLIYHQGKYWNIGEELPKPTDEERANMKAFVEKHAK